MAEKTKGELLKDKLFYNPKSGYEVKDEKTVQKAYAYAEGYKRFLDAAKTEREAVEYVTEAAKKAGFAEFDEGASYKPGDKVYLVNRKKALILAVIGAEPLDKGINIAAAHIDSPRLDLKPNPVYEDGGLALFKTHYYGGVKKYQWTAIPLALHGVLIRKDGEVLKFALGESADDPLFTITDLLPHLAKEQMALTLKDGVKGEDLNALIGSRSFEDKKATEKVKLYVLNLLHETYGINEADFQSAELCLVPAFSARDIGFDRSLIGAYGHDDRVCAYPCLTALLELDVPKRTCIAVLADKEEIGSTGNTGLQAAYLRHFIEDLCAASGTNARRCLQASRCLSADVNAAFDPTYPDVTEKRNAAMINRGVVVTKYTGHGGKGDTNDASAEFFASVRAMLDEDGVLWQTGELGKVDLGGGGTVAKYIAHMNMDVIDLGVPVLSMHSPFEVVSKLDVYMAHKAVAALFAR